MGFFTHEAARMIEGRSKYITETFESVCEDDTIELCSEDLIEAGFDGIIAMNENYNSIMRRMAYAEASALEETGKEFVYTEGVLGDLYNTIKSFLMKIWERIKSLFKRFIMILDSYTKNDKDFAKKYQKQIFSKSGDTSDFSFKGYKWVIEDSGFEAAMNECSTESASHFTNADDRTVGDKDTSHYEYQGKGDYDKNVDKESDKMEKLRGRIFNKFAKVGGRTDQNTLTSEEFRKEIHDLFRNGETEKEELDSKDLDVHNMYNKLITSNQDRKTAKKGFDESKKSIDQDIKALERLHNESIKNSPGTPEGDKWDTTKFYQANASIQNGLIEKFKKETGKEAKNDKGVYINGFNNWINNQFKETEDEARNRTDMRNKNLAYFAKYSRITKECLLTINSELLNAMKERSRQYKACLIAYVHYRPSSESAYTESYLIGKEKNVGGNIFSGISFV